ncbi:PREDICTED: uncharacterized protein LOC109168440 [Ipomoea nil]|uniref:uncharacterized protein LOC109168440 n=1 Tax=Ipomoea nil TaxID=35883 RepID=UPI0009016084|nr:PREDICTED: uncharacterized protein LOC109168440 [Ipomoea nil]
MEVLSNPFKFNGAIKRALRRRKYSRVEGTRKSVKVVRFGSKRSWRIKAVPRLRWKMLSPVKLWTRIKNAYVKMMLSFAGNVGYLSGGAGNGIEQKRIGRGRGAKMGYTTTEFENRLMYEIYKSLVPSMELYPMQ